MMVVGKPGTRPSDLRDRLVLDALSLPRLMCIVYFKALPDSSGKMTLRVSASSGPRSTVIRMLSGDPRDDNRELQAVGSAWGESSSKSGTGPCRPSTSSGPQPTVRGESKPAFCGGVVQHVSFCILLIYRLNCSDTSERRCLRDCQQLGSPVKVDANQALASTLTVPRVVQLTEWSNVELLRQECTLSGESCEVAQRPLIGHPWVRIPHR